MTEIRITNSGSELLRKEGTDEVYAVYRSAYSKGDTIEINIPQYKVHLCVSDEEMEKLYRFLKGYLPRQ